MDRERIASAIAKHSNRVVSLDIHNNEIEYSQIIQHRAIKAITGDEEIVRAFIISRLVNELGYSPERIEIEKEYQAGRPKTITSRIDIILRDANDDAFLFIETKSPSDYQNGDRDAILRDQLYGLAALEKAGGHSVKYLVLYTISDTGEEINDECIIIDFERFSTFSEWDESRDNTNTIPKRYGHAQKTPYIKASEKDLADTFTSEMLRQLQMDLHDVLWGGGGTDDNEIFSSLTNLILAKIQDEDEKEDGELYDFQSLSFEKEGLEEFETNEELFERINNLYRRALRSKLYISDESTLKKTYVVDTNKFSLSKLKYAVQKMEGLSFVEGKNSLDGKDILGDFFEGIIRQGFKQSKGQFFTHVNVVRFMLWGIQADKLAIKRIKEDKQIPYIIDPSAGSGTFLIEYMKFITCNMKYRFRSELGTARAVLDKINSDWFYPDYRENKWAQTYIYGIESNYNLGTATKVNMILHGDGSTNIFVKDGLLPFHCYDKEVSPNALHESEPDENYGGRDINGQFDLILTNPPFSVELDNDTLKTLSRVFFFSDRKNSENLFIERWYQLLRENGRLAAVLPESVFDTSENRYIRLFIYKYFKVKAVVSLPQLTFEPYTSTKTSILFAQKKTANEISLWNEVWDKNVRQYSQLRTRVQNIVDVLDGKKKKDKLPSIRDLSEEDMKGLIHELLGRIIADIDAELDLKALVDKYRDDVVELLSFDVDLKDMFGHGNAWWVFKKTASEIDYGVLMAEAESIGYKRTKRGEKETLNELYRVSATGEIMVDDGICTSILDSMRLIEWD